MRKRRCLEKVLARLLIQADFKTVQKKFLDQGIDEDIVKQYLEEFKVLRDKRDLGENKDIELWGKKPWDEFKEFVDKTKEEKSKSEEKRVQKTEGAELVSEDDNWFVYKISTHEAAMLYGSGTKWCITQKDGQHWKSYTRKGSCFYFLISKTKSKEDPYYKIAVQVQQSSIGRGARRLSYWDAEDKHHQAEIEGEQKIPKFDYAWFKIDGVVKEADVDNIIERIDNMVERWEEIRSNPEENDTVSYLLEQEINLKYARIDDDVREKLEWLKNYCELDESDIGDFDEVLKDRISDIETAGIHYVNNEISSISLGQDEYEIDNDEDLFEELESLSDEDKKQVERSTNAVRRDNRGNVRWTIYYGDEYERFVLVVNEKKLDDLLVECGYGEEENEENENDED